MTRPKARRGKLWIPAVFAAFYLGIAVGWMLRASPAPQPVRVVDSTDHEIPIKPNPAKQEIELTKEPATIRLKPDPPADKAEGTSGAAIASDALVALRHHHLKLPLDGARVEAMEGQFDDPRGGGTRGHEAVDLLAPRNTPIHAVEDGVIAKLFESKAGGTTIYQFDPSGRFCYYYAHLERYAPGLQEKQHVDAGDTIGFVGTSGNAPKNTPHLHFAIFELTSERHWWQGRAIDPYLVFKK